METQTPAKTGTDTTVQVIGAIFGTAHFIFQSLADMTAHAEGSIVESVTKGHITKADCIANRRNTTDLKQQQLMAKFKEAQAKIKAKAQPQVQPRPALS